MSNIAPIEAADESVDHSLDISRQNTSLMAQLRMLVLLAMTTTVDAHATHTATKSTPDVAAVTQSPHIAQRHFPGSRVRTIATYESSNRFDRNTRTCSQQGQNALWLELLGGPEFPSD